MNLQQQYHELWYATKQKFESGKFGVDPLLYDETDRRCGLTLLVRPSQAVKDSISIFLDEIRAVEPALYFYAQSDIHLTVMSIISCYAGFELDQIEVNAHRDCIQQALAGIKPFTIHMKGITAAPSAIMIQGFPEQDRLNQIRNSLRNQYQNSELPSRMDVRYAISTAHSTVIRFPQKPKNPSRLIEMLQKYREVDFGAFEVRQLEFVYNDWYQRSGFVQKLAMFELAKI